MKRKIGTYITQSTASEHFKAYVPQGLPPQPPIELTGLYPLLEKATLALAQLSGIQKAIPNPALFTYMYVRKEALLSSQIEGTQSSFADLMLFENDQQPDVALEDVEEVSNYVQAITYGIKRLNQDFPLSLRLLREIHGVLLAGGRGSKKTPGDFRRSQNWIGGSKPSNALFVPPPVEYLHDCLANFEQFLHDDNLPVLIKIGVAHVQFETIHPFLDGNGRLGRLLITLMLCNSGMLQEPLLYLSLYLKQHRRLYYDLLQEVREHGTWETWLEFFLEGIKKSAQQVITTTEAIIALFAQDAATIDTIGRAKFSCERIHEYLKKLPQVTVHTITEALDMSAPTARSGLNTLTELGILEEISGEKRNKVYVYRTYLKILEAGTEPLPVR